MLRAFPTFLAGRPGMGLLALRIVAGGAMALHGYGKMLHPYTWMGTESWAPGWLQAVAASSEFFGGIALAVGLLTPLACIMIMGTMLAALFTVHFPHGDPWVAKSGGSFESALNYLVVATTLLLAGPGKCSLDYALFGRGRAAIPEEHEVPFGRKNLGPGLYTLRH